MKEGEKGRKESERSLRVAGQCQLYLPSVSRAFGAFSLASISLDQSHIVCQLRRNVSYAALYSLYPLISVSAVIVSSVLSESVCGLLREIDRLDLPRVTSPRKKGTMRIARRCFHAPLIKKGGNINRRNP